MGRSRSVLVGLKLYKRDKPTKNIKTTEQLSLFLYKSQGPVAEETQKLIGFGPDFEPIVEEKKVRKVISNLKAQVVSTREFPLEYTEKLITEQVEENKLGISTTRAKNSYARETAAAAQAVYLAARVGNITLSAADKRVLTPLAEGRFFDAVYGKEGQFERGTIASRLQKVTVYRTPEAKAIAAAKAQELRAARYGDEFTPIYR